MASTNINTNKIQMKDILSLMSNVTSNKQAQDMNNSSAFKNVNAIDHNMEEDLEANNAKNHEIGFEGNIKEESLNKNYDYEIFNKIGLIYDITNNTLTLDYDAYSNTTIKDKEGNETSSGNFLQHFSDIDQLKIIKMYFEIESLRYANQKMFDYSEDHIKLFNRLSVIAMVLNWVVPYLPELVGLANNIFKGYEPFFAGASGIIIVIIYFFTRILMSTTANKTYFEQMQLALIKLRFAVETVIMGSYIVPTTIKIGTKITQKKLQDSGYTESELTEFLTNFLNIIKIDLENIYQTEKNQVITDLLGEAITVSDKVIKVFGPKIKEAAEQIKKIQPLLSLALSAGAGAGAGIASNGQTVIIRF